jgi:myo-inositol-1(or 4)-monophosphatase
MSPELQRLVQLVRRAAREELLPRFNQVQRRYKADGSQVTEADLAMQQRLTAELAERWPDVGLLGEEMTAAEQQARLARPGNGLWLLDPLDGTSNFAAGIPFFSVSLALLREDRVQLGVVYDPSRDECFAAERGAGAFLDAGALLGPPLVAPLAARPPPPLNRCIALVDLKRLPADLVVRLAQSAPYGSQRGLGSVALEWCWIAAGRCHLYLHGRQQLWDYAAASLILEEAGGQACTLDGRPVLCLELRPRTALAALDPGLFAAWRDWLGVPHGPP